jgi:hypothetical protein
MKQTSSGSSGSLMDVDEVARVAQTILPPGLVGDDLWQWVAPLQPLVPPAASVGCFECRLVDGDPRVDFQVAIPNSRPSRRAVAQFLAGSPRLPDSHAWRGARGLLEGWTNPESVLFEGVTSVWFEFDLPAQPPPAGAPVLEPFLYLSATDRCFKDSHGVGDHAPRLQHILDAGLDALSVKGLLPAVRDQIAHCNRNLPFGTRYLHAAAMPARRTEAVRLVTSVPVEALPEFLKSVDWPGSTDELQSQLGRLGIFSSHLPIHLDVSDRVHSRLGFEFFHPTSPYEDERWGVLFDELERCGACSPSRRAVVSSWVNRRGERSDTSVDANHRTVMTVRYLTIKAVIEPGQPLSAKAYLPFSRFIR